MSVFGLKLVLEQSLMDHQCSLNALLLAGTVTSWIHPDYQPTPTPTPAPLLPPTQPFQLFVVINNFCNVGVFGLLKTAGITTSN